MGLKTDLLIKEPQVDLICIVCQDLASDPRQCETCDVLLCQECVANMPLKKCPNKCHNEDQIFKTRVPRILKNMISELEIHCTHYPECEEVIKIKQLENHLQLQCQMVKVRCSNPLCTSFQTKKKMKKFSLTFNNSEVIKNLRKQEEETFYACRQECASDILIKEEVTRCKDTVEFLG